MEEKLEKLNKIQLDESYQIEFDFKDFKEDKG